MTGAGAVLDELALCEHDFAVGAARAGSSVAHLDEFRSHASARYYTLSRNALRNANVDAAACERAQNARDCTAVAATWLLRSTRWVLKERSAPQGWQDPASLGANNFDFLRLVLAVLVIFSHSFELLRNKPLPEPLREATGQVSFGDVGVNGFFVISGYLVTHSWFRRKSIGDYVLKRVRRIYPAFLVACAVCVFLVGPFSTDDPWRPFQTRDLLKSVAAALVLRGDFQDYAFPTNPYPYTMNGSTWSIPFEVRCYAAVAVLSLIGMLSHRRALVFFALSLVTAVVFSVFNLNFGGNLLSYVVGWPNTWARLIPLYLAGVVFYLYRQRIPYSNKLAALAALTLFAGALVPHALAAVLPISGTYFLFWLAYNPRIPLQNWGKLGDFSYGTYLYAFPAQQLLIRFVPAAHDPLLLFALATPIALAAGIISWHLIEKRFLSRQRAHPAPAAHPAVS